MIPCRPSPGAATILSNDKTTKPPVPKVSNAAEMSP